jgi:uncharacterized ferritin-like protein (DUF455 family)
MNGLSPADIMFVRGVQLRRDAAREQCFTVVHLHTELRLSNDSSDASKREALHRDVNNEIQSLEISAQTLIDFPAAPWDLRLQLARQCWDETRHARLFYRSLVELGGRKGEFPIANHEWSVVCALDSLPARLTVQNRTFEGGSLDTLRKAGETLRQNGEENIAEVMETVLADEILHVRFANQWINRLRQENPRTVLEIARAMNFLQTVNAALAPLPGEVDIEGQSYAGVDHSVRTNVQDRAHASFTAKEIVELSRKENWTPPASTTERQEF